MQQQTAMQQPLQQVSGVPPVQGTGHFAVYVPNMICLWPTLLQPADARFFAPRAGADGAPQVGPNDFHEQAWPSIPQSASDIPRSQMFATQQLQHQQQQHHHHHQHHHHNQQLQQEQQHHNHQQQQQQPASSHSSPQQGTAQPSWWNSDSPMQQPGTQSEPVMRAEVEETPDATSSVSRRRQVEQRCNVILQDICRIKRDLTFGCPQVVAARISELYAVSGVVWHLSRHPDGREVVELALAKVLNDDARTELCKDFRNRIKEAMGDKHASKVIRKIVEVIPVDIAGFVADEISSIAVAASTHKHGCSIICKLIQHFRGEECIARLEQEFRLCGIRGLARNRLGRHVLEAILQCGSDSLKHVIASTLATDILTFSCCQHASNVVETALRECCPADVEMLLARMLSGPVSEDLVLQMSQQRYGIYVVKVVLTQLLGQFKLAGFVAQEVRSAPSDVQKNPHYRRLMELLSKVVEKDVDPAVLA